MIFITGASGFLGKELLARILYLEPEQKVAILLRPNGLLSAEQRSERILKELFGAENVSKYKDRLEVISGDLTEENFGLGDTEFNKLGSRVSAIYHSAASTSLEQPLKKARGINVAGTKQISSLSKLAKVNNPDFRRLYHISTAYAVGDTKEVVTPNELSLNRNFRNSYEKSKAEAEILVRSLEGNVPYTIFRPSIIVGDSITGKTSAFNVLYVPARLLALGMLNAIPAFPHVPFDVVPVDYVADAIYKLSSREENPKIAFHLCSGVGRETSPSEILEQVVEALNKYTKRKRDFESPPMLSPDLLNILISSLKVATSKVKLIEKTISNRFDVLSQTMPFIPYMTRNPRFCTELTKDIIDPSPLFQNYAEALFKYCLETNWGKKNIQKDQRENTWLYSYQNKLAMV